MTPSSIELASDEISLLDILRFFQRQYKLISGITFAAVVLGLGAGLTAVPQFQRELLLGFELPLILTTQTIVADGDNVRLVALENEQIMKDEIAAIGLLTLEEHLATYLSDPEILPKATANFEAVPLRETRQNLDHLKVVIVAENQAAVEGFNQSALEALQEAMSDFVQSYLALDIQRLDILIQNSEQKISLLEERFIEPVNQSGALSSETVLNVLRFQNQQAVLAEELGKLVDYELARSSLIAAQNDADIEIKIETLADVDSQQETSLVRFLILSAIAGFLVSVLIAIIADQIPQIHKALSEP